MFTLLLSITLSFTAYAQAPIDPDCLPQKAHTPQKIKHKSIKKKASKTKPKHKKPMTIRILPARPSQHAKPAKRCVPLSPPPAASSVSETGGGGGAASFNQSGYNTELRNSNAVASFSAPHEDEINQEVPVHDEGKGEPSPPPIEYGPRNNPIPPITYPGGPPLILRSGPPPFLLPTQSVSPSQIIPAPVPEPETYCLMLAGLGIVGFVSKRRKTSKNSL